MKIQKTKGGFTLIELLVVITIIGILATGATATYTSQIQKARDTTRISDVSAFKSAIEQIFQDAAEYPELVPAVVTKANLKCDGSDSTKFTLDCLTHMQYIAKLPKDPKSGQPGNLSALDYIYAVSHVDGVLRQQYEISSGFENAGNVTGKAGNDSGNDKNRFEVGTGISKIFTAVKGEDTFGYSTTDLASVSAKFTSAITSCAPAANLSSAFNAQSGPAVVKGDCSPS